MLTLDNPTAGIRDYSISAASAHVALVPSACGASAERSDPRMEWALRFDQGLKRAAERIRVWSRDSASLADDGLEVPSREAITRAFEIINEMKVLVMDRVAPVTATLLNFKGASLGSGGEISLELGSGPFAVTYRIEPDGTVTELFFCNNQLFHREQFAR